RCEARAVVRRAAAPRPRPVRDDRRRPAVPVVLVEGVPLFDVARRTRFEPGRDRRAHRAAGPRRAARLSSRRIMRKRPLILWLIGLGLIASPVYYYVEKVFVAQIPWTDVGAVFAAM